VKRQDVYYEQPTVKFTNEFIVEALINDGAKDVVRQYSTVANINKEYTNKLTNPQLSVKSLDYNGDSRPERIDIDFEFVLATSETVKAVNVLFYLQYYISDEINTQFKTMVYKSINAPNGGNLAYAQMKGDLRLVQKNFLAEGTIMRQLYNSTLESDYDNYGIQGIIDRYNVRNQTTMFDARPSVLSFTTASSTQILMQLEIPTYQAIWYYTSVLEIIKFAWIQYFALLIPIYTILYVWLYGFIVKTNVLK
jgi:hypothetical protein